MIFSFFFKVSFLIPQQRNFAPFKIDKFKGSNDTNSL